MALVVGVLTCIRFQGSFAHGLDVIEDGNVLVILMMMIGFFFPWFIVSLVYWASRPIGISLLASLHTRGLLPKPTRRKVRANCCLPVSFD